MPTEVIDILDSEDDIAITPLPKRRKLVPIVAKSSPNRSLDLLSAFGAQKSHSSVSAMSRTPVKGHRLRGAANISYAESPASTLDSPRTVSSFDSDQGEEDGAMVDLVSEDELISEDVIHGQYQYQHHHSLLLS